MAVHFQRYHRDKAVYVGGYSGFGVSASRFGARIQAMSSKKLLSKLYAKFVHKTSYC